MNRARRIALIVITLLSCHLIADTLSAQKHTPFLPVDHWSLAAARRLETLGLITPSVDHSSSSFTESQMRALLIAARERAAGKRFDGLARGYHDRFVHEFGDTVAAASLSLSRRSAALGAATRNGQTGPGEGWFHGEDWTGAVELPDRTTLTAQADLSLVALERLAVRAGGSFENDEVTLEEAHARLGLGPIAVWAGRRAVRFGPANSALVLSGSTPFDAVGFQVDPFRLPGFLRQIGPIRFETFLSRLERNGRRIDPWFWAARGSVQPARSFVIGVNRGALFGGDGHPATFSNVIKMVVGAYGGNNGDFENQVVSVDARLVINSESQPLELYAEWGSDESSGGWKKAPGINLGVVLPTLGTWAALQTSVEYTTIFEKPECCNSFWYRNIFFRGAWAKDNMPLGHPLGGHGNEVAASLGSDLLETRLALRARVALRNRGDENLYAPEHQGRSTLFQGSAAYRLGRAELDFAGAIENAKTWRTTALRGGLRAYF